MQHDFLHRRRVQLETDLRKLLQLPAICRSRDLSELSSSNKQSSHPLTTATMLNDVTSSLASTTPSRTVWMNSFGTSQFWTSSPSRAKPYLSRHEPIQHHDL